MQITHIPATAGGTFEAIDDGRRVAELTYRQHGAVHVIDHTWVDPSQRGKGVAGLLMEAVVSAARANGWKIDATCSYAVWSIGKHPEWQDVTE